MEKVKQYNRFIVTSDWRNYEKLHVVLRCNPRVTIITSESDYCDGKSAMFIIATKNYLSEDSLYKWIEDSIFLSDIEITEDVPNDCLTYTVGVEDCEAEDLALILYIHKQIYAADVTPMYLHEGIKSRNVIVKTAMKLDELADWISDTTIYDFEITKGRYVTSF